MELDHPYLVGHIRESLLANVLEPVLPAGVRCGTGKIIDALGGESKEIDVVIYADDLHPCVLYTSRLGLFPVESVLMTVEVKSKTSATEIDSAIENANSVLSLKTFDETARVEKLVREARALRPVTNLFAFASDLQGTTELERYLERDVRATSDPSLGGLCVLNAGYWGFTKSDLDRDLHWRPGTYGTTDFEEGLEFLGVLANSIPKIHQNRHNFRPLFGRYLQP